MAVTGTIAATANSVTVNVKGLPPNVPVPFGISSAGIPPNPSHDNRYFTATSYPVDQAGELHFVENALNLLPDLPRVIVANIPDVNGWTLIVTSLT